MKLPYFSTAVVKRLRDATSANIPLYKNKSSWIESFAMGGQHTFESSLTFGPPPQLLISNDDNAVNDAENSKLVYEWLKSLPPTIAMEERLWARLAHEEFYAYMHARWPVDRESVVSRRYLLEGRSFGSLSRHGIARLWWGAHLTRDSKRANPYELTEALFLRQDIYVQILERSLGKCEVVRTSVLEFLTENQTWLSSQAFTRRIQILLRELNLVGGVAILDTLSITDIKGYLMGIGKTLALSDSNEAGSVSEG